MSEDHARGDKQKLIRSTTTIVGFLVALGALFRAVEPEEITRWFDVLREYPLVSAIVFSAVGFAVIGFLLWRDAKLCKENLEKSNEKISAEAIKTAKIEKELDEQKGRLSGLADFYDKVQRGEIVIRGSRHD